MPIPNLTMALSTLATQRPRPGATAVARPQIEVVSDRSTFDLMEHEWQAVESTADGAVLFQSYAWCRAIWDHWIAVGRVFEPVILVRRDRGTIVGILPLKIASYGPLRIATGFGEPFQQYTDVLVAGEHRAETTASLLAAAMGLEGCDGAQLLKVRDESYLASTLAGWGAVRANTDAAPFVDLRPFPSFADYQATVSAKTRKSMRSSRNRLSRMGQLRHQVLADPCKVGSLVERAHAGRERWLAELGLTSRAFRDPTFAAFAHRLAVGSAGVATLVMSLELDDMPISDQWGFLFNGRYYAYLASWNPAFADVSPGKLHLEDVIRTCHDRGIGIADFLAPGARYKFTWTNKATGTADYILPLTWRGHLYNTVWTGALRPALKTTALALPSKMRSRLKAIVFRRNRKFVDDPRGTSSA